MLLNMRFNDDCKGIIQQKETSYIFCPLIQGGLQFSEFLTDLHEGGEGAERKDKLMKLRTSPRKVQVILEMAR